MQFTWRVLILIFCCWQQSVIYQTSDLFGFVRFLSENSLHSMWRFGPFFYNESSSVCLNHREIWSPLSGHQSGDWTRIFSRQGGNLRSIGDRISCNFKPCKALPTFLFSIFSSPLQSWKNHGPPLNSQAIKTVLKNEIAFRRSVFFLLFLVITAIIWSDVWSNIF